VSSDDSLGENFRMFVLPREAALGSEGKGDPLLCIQNTLNAMCVCVCVCVFEYVFNIY